MAVIQKKIRLIGSKCEEDSNVIFDSGSTYSCIRPELAKKLGIILPLPIPKEFETAEEDKKVIAKEAVRLDFILNGSTFSDEFMLISKLSEQVIIGAATMQKWRMKLNFETDEVIIDPSVTKLRLL